MRKIFTWPNVVGAILLGVSVVPRILDWIGRVDTVATHINDTAWLVTMWDIILSPPSWFPMLIAIAGFGVIVCGQLLPHRKELEQQSEALGARPAGPPDAMHRLAIEVGTGDHYEKVMYRSTYEKFRTVAISVNNVGSLPVTNIRLRLAKTMPDQLLMVERKVPYIDLHPDSFTLGVGQKKFVDIGVF